MSNTTKAPPEKKAALQPTNVQFLYRHQNGRYYVRTYSGGKEKWTSCRVANKIGKFSLIMKDLERRWVGKDDRDRVVRGFGFEIEDVAVVEDTADDAWARRGVDREAEVADGDGAIVGDANGGADAPDEAPPRTGGRGADDGVFLSLWAIAHLRTVARSVLKSRRRSSSLATAL
jgi:hypothetical protein